MAGGIRPQGYVDHRVECVDPLGLTGCSSKKPGPEVPEYHVGNFEYDIAINRQVSSDEVFYKYHGKDNKLGQTHNYVTKKLYTSEAELRNDLAILDEWGRLN